MKIQISKRFVKDTKKIADSRILAKIRRVLEHTQAAESISEITAVEEMSGHPKFYRIKFDYRYRIGIYYDDEIVQFLRVGSREDFYKKFP
ncbi:MAG: type II toxin-antitoxin system RelE/ParE family toxin [Desulfococcaceae bacterium]